MKNLSVIIPCYNEEKGLQELYIRIKNVLGTFSFSSEVILIDDGSDDKTSLILNEIAEKDDSVKVIHFSRNFGQQAAITAGINYCTTDFAVIMDADLQDPPELISQMIVLQEKEQADVVYCVRSARKGESFFKKFSAKMFYRILNYMSDIQFPLDTGDFRLIDRKVIDQFNHFHEYGKYVRGLISWSGFKQIPLYYEREARFAGETKYPLHKMIGYASTAMLYFSKKPLRLATSLGFIAVIVGIVLSVWFTLGKIYGFSNAETGWTSIMTSVIFFGGVQLLTVGVLGRYIGIIFDEVKGRPEYIVDSTKNIER